ncbi:hypothetical protein LP420_16335 [Massilia sp. B-10]|nr:hypothetical protein LP420_16335 [Massilia sp. B-10]
MPAYHDPKRTTWLLSLFVPASLVLGPLLYLWHHAAWRLWIPVAITYFLIPLLDAWVGEDRSNPPEDAVLRSAGSGPLLPLDHVRAGAGHVGVHHLRGLVRGDPGSARARHSGRDHQHRDDGRILHQCRP